MEIFRFAIVGCLLGILGCGNTATTTSTGDSSAAGSGKTGASQQPTSGNNATNPTKTGLLEYDNLEGKWRVIDAQRDGETWKEKGKSWADGSSFTFHTLASANTHDVKIVDRIGDAISYTEFELVPDKFPKEMNIGTKSHHNSWERVGIYKLEGDTLTICVHPKERPTGFATKKGDNRTLFVMKKESPPSK